MNSTKHFLCNVHAICILWIWCAFKNMWCSTPCVESTYCCCLQNVFSLLACSQKVLLLSSQTMVPAHNYLLSQFPGLNICKHEIIIAWQKNITISPMSITTDSFVNIPSLLALDPVFLQCFYNVMATQWKISPKKKWKTMASSLKHPSRRQRSRTSV